MTGKHHKSRSAKLNRTLAIGAVAGATAIGLGALSSVNAPAAHTDWWALIAGPGSGNASGNDTLSGNGTGNGNGNFGNNNVFIGGQNGNGNTTQTTWGAGNNMNTQFNLLSPVTGDSAINTGNVTATGGSSTATSSPTTAGATSGTAGSANARTKTDGVAGNNVAQSPSKTNRSEDGGTNSTNHSGNNSTNNNTNGGGNTTNEN